MDTEYLKKEHAGSHVYILMLCFCGCNSEPVGKKDNKKCPYLASFTSTELPTAGSTDKSPSGICTSGYRALMHGLTGF